MEPGLVVLAHHHVEDLFGKARKRSTLHPLSLDLRSLACSPQLMPQLSPGHPCLMGQTISKPPQERTETGAACPGHSSAAQSPAQGLLESLMVPTLVPTPGTMARKNHKHAEGCCRFWGHFTSGSQGSDATWDAQPPFLSCRSTQFAGCSALSESAGPFNIEEADPSA